MHLGHDRLKGSCSLAAARLRGAAARLKGAAAELQLNQGEAKGRTHEAL